MSERKYFLTPDEIRIIQEYYDGTSLRTNKILRMIGPKYPRWYIKRKANEMGLSHIKKNPDWNEREIEFLHKNYPRKGWTALIKGLQKINGGIWRSPTAIQLKAKREHINKRSDGFTMRMVEELLGRDHKTIALWMQKGFLDSKKKGTRRTKVQGGDMHHFEAKDLRTFVITHPDEIDLRRVEPRSFIHLIAGMI